MNKLLTASMGLLAAAAVMTGCTASGQTEVTTASARAGRDLSSMTWQGTAEALNTVTVLPAGSGKITEIPAAEGQHVKKGDVLFVVDSSDAALLLQQAEAAFQTAQVAFDNADKAQKGNTGAGPLEIAYADARTNYERTKLLYDNGDVSQADFEAAKSKMDTTALQLENAKNSQSGGYDSSSAQLASAQASLDIARKRFDDCSVKAPIDGLVTQINVKPGEMVSPQTAAAVVIDDSGEEVDIQVADTDIGQLAQDMPMDIQFQSIGETARGNVREISPVCDAKTGMYTVKIALSPDSSQSYVGLAANVKVSGSEVSPSVYIPTKCLINEDGSSWVYLVTDGSVSKREVAPGRKKNAYTEITEGLTEGDEVVLQSSKPLTDGSKVRVLTVK